MLIVKVFMLLVHFILQTAHWHANEQYSSLTWAWNVLQTHHSRWTWITAHYSPQRSFLDCTWSGAGLAGTLINAKEITCQHFLYQSKQDRYLMVIQFFSTYSLTEVRTRRYEAWARGFNSWSMCEPIKNNIMQLESVSKRSTRSIRRRQETGTSTSGSEDWLLVRNLESSIVKAITMIRLHQWLLDITVATSPHSNINLRSNPAAHANAQRAHSLWTWLIHYMIHMGWHCATAMRLLLNISDNPLNLAYSVLTDYMWTTPQLHYSSVPPRGSICVHASQIHLLHGDGRGKLIHGNIYSLSRDPSASPGILEVTWSRSGWT